MGLEMAKSFAEDGATVVITGRNLAKLEDAAKSHANISPFQCDVAKDADMIKLRDAMEKKGGVDFMVNSEYRRGVSHLLDIIVPYARANSLFFLASDAGVLHTFDIKDDYDIQKQFQEVDIDVNGVLRGVNYFLPQLRKKESATIMNVSSALAYVPSAFAPVYCASKAFVHSYTTSLRISLKSTNVKVVELLPPAVKTPMTDDFDPEVKDGFEFMEVDDFVAAVRKGLNDGSDEITPGQAIQLKLMSRIAPGFIVSQVNKNAK